MTLPIPGRPPTFESLNLQGQVDHLYKVVDVIARNTQSLAGRSITARNIAYQSVRTENLTPGGTYEFGAGTQSAPSITFNLDTDTGLYLSGTHGFSAVVGGELRTTWSSDGFLVHNLQSARFVLSAGSMLIDDAAFTWDLSGDTTLIAAGDIRGGSATLQRMLWDYSLQTLSVFDSSGNEDISLDAAGNSWYNGSGNFGFGTITPDAKVDIESTSVNLRLTHTSGTWYTNLSTSSTGIFLIAPSDGGVTIDLDMVGSDVYLLVSNEDDSDTASHARLQIRSSLGGAGGGDPILEWSTDAFGANTKFSMGIDNSDSDKLKISSGSVLGTTDRLTITTAGLVGIGNASPSVLLHLLSGTAVGSSFSTDDLLTLEKSTNCNINLVTDTAGVNTLLFSDTTRARGAVRYTHSTDTLDFLTSGVSSTSITTSDLIFSTSTSGGSNTILADNTSNTASSQARFRARVAGTSAGDAYALFSVAGVQDWSFGLDNSDSDSFKISGAGALGSSDYFTVLVGGNVGVNTNGPDRKLDVLDTSGPQFRLTYTDGSVYTDFQTDSTGNLVVNPTSLAYMRLSTESTVVKNLDLSSSTTGHRVGLRFFDNNFGTEHGRMQYAGENSAGSRWFGFINSGSDYLAFASDTQSYLSANFGVERFRHTTLGVIVNEDGVSTVDFRAESDDEPYCLMVESDLNNLVFCAGAEPAFQSMDGGIFLADANVVPTGNPTGGGYLYSEGGALKWRGSGGTVTPIGPS